MVPAAHAAITEEEILRIADKLPTAPRLLVELGALIRDPKVDSENIVALLKQDAPLTARIIRMANSAAYSPSEPVGSLERAVAHVGFTEVHRLVGAVAATQIADQKMIAYPIDGGRLRLNCLFVAVLMEELARWADERPNTCYTVGLLRTIGIMGLSRLDVEGAVAPFTDCDFELLGDWEMAQWGMTNPEVAEKILLHWKLPAETVSAIRYQYAPGNRHNPIIHLLRLAAAAAAERFSSIPGEEGYWKLSPETFLRAGLEHDAFQRACSKAHRTYERLRIAIA